MIALLMVLWSGLLTVPGSEWKALSVPVQQHGSVVECSFEVREGSRIQLMLMSRVDAERFHRGRPVRPLYMSGFSSGARFRQHVPDAGDYVLIVDNRLDARGSAVVQISINISHPQQVEAWELPPERKRLVTALSVFFFGIVVAFAAAHLRRAAQ